MSIDTYSVCPCGSGKKIKFCKCKDSVHELDRVLTMIEGGQYVPALDKLSNILKEHPDAAWALAIRGRLLMDLREYATLAENAERFTRLQPSNPLALTQRAASALFAQDVNGATELMLEALTESGQTVDSFVLDVASLVAYALAGNGIPLTARVYAMLALVSDNYEDNKLAAKVLSELNGDPQINLLAKSMPELIERPAGADWAERFDEATLLLHNNKVALAQTKFESLQRTAPMQPSVLSGLLQCAIWRGDHAAQSELLQKLSHCESLDEHQRVVNHAMSLVITPESPALGVAMLRISAEVDSIDEPQMALAAHGRFYDLPPEMLKQLADESGIPPRAAYQILDRDPPADESLLAATELPIALGLALVHGRQTDRAPMIECMSVQEQHAGKVRELLDQVIPGIDWKNEAMDPVPLVQTARPQIAGIRLKKEQLETFEKIRGPFNEQKTREALMDTPLKLFGGRSLRQATDDPALTQTRAALVRVIAGEDTLVGHDANLIADLCQHAAVSPLDPIQTDNDGLEVVANYDLDRVDPSNLDAEGLIYLIQRASQVSATIAGTRASHALLKMDLPTTGETAGAKIIAYSFLMQHAGTTDEAIAQIDAAITYAEANKLPTGNLMLNQAMLLAQTGHPEAFQSTVQKIISRHRQDPEVMGRLQQMLMQMGLLRPDGSPARNASRPASVLGGPAAMGGSPAPAAAAPSSGLWTPDGGSSGATTSPESGGGSKLWVPGMD